MLPLIAVPPGWDLSAAGTASWTVAVFHSWTKGFHKVQTIDLASRTIRFSEPAKFPFGEYVYCSDRRCVPAMAWAVGLCGVVFVAGCN